MGRYLYLLKCQSTGRVVLYEDDDGELRKVLVPHDGSDPKFIDTPRTHDDAPAVMGALVGGVVGGVFFGSLGIFIGGVLGLLVGARSLPARTGSAQRVRQLGAVCENPPSADVGQVRDLDA